jgi:hypothetical protein
VHVEQISVPTADPEGEGRRHWHGQPPRPELGDTSLEGTIYLYDLRPRSSCGDHDVRGHAGHRSAKSVDLLLDAAGDRREDVFVYVEDSQGVTK